MWQAIRSVARVFFSFSSFLMNILIKRTSSFKSSSITLMTFSSFKKYRTLKKQHSAWNFMFWGKKKTQKNPPLPTKCSEQ